MSEPTLLEVFKNSAEKMLLASELGQQRPDLAHEAAYRFGVYLDRRVADLLGAGKDLIPLFEPGPDYVLRPELVDTFMQRQGLPLPQRVAGESTSAYTVRIAYSMWEDR